MNYSALLAHFPKITYTRYKKLFRYFVNSEHIWKAELNELIEAGIEAPIADEFISWREAFPIQKTLEKLEKEAIQTISINEPDYPSLLSEIPDPPHTLFIRGKLPTNLMPTLAVVGTRHHTSYGKYVCQDLISKLTNYQIAIISGLALGIDGIAHEATLQSNGITIAVLGSGIDQGHIYPSLHYKLAEKIISSGGALISEYPPGFSPTRYSFPARNRIIAGLSLGTLVIEAREESGALITARHALEYNREVMAVPHPLNSKFGNGNHKLIKQGAALITSAEDIIETLNIQQAQVFLQNRKTFSPSPIEEKILNILSSEPQHIDFITKKSGLESQIINSTLTLLEMKGRVKNMGGMMYVLK